MQIFYISNQSVTMCNFRWVTNERFAEYLFGQCGQGYDFLPLCVCKCCVKYCLWENFEPHIVQEKGFSPEWARKCFSNDCREVNLASQILQECGFMVLWVIKW